MVATWNPAAAADYYTRQTAYYTDSGEPAGTWYAPAGSFGLIDGTIVDNAVFERLFAGTDETGASLLSNGGGRLDRTAAFDVTLSAPRSVSILWALGNAETSTTIEEAQARAVRKTLDLLQKEAVRARRGRGGSRIEAVPLTAAVFRHGESRPTEHEDGQVFGDPNLHTHCVILNLAQRADGSVGALHSKILRDWKMAAGATYHAALAAELQAAGFVIDRTGRNGIFEIAGVEDHAIRYFSARRREIEAELAEAGGTRVDAARAVAVARSTRRAKGLPDAESRTEIWCRAAQAIGIEVSRLVEHCRSFVGNRSAADDLLRRRLAELPRSLTETRSVVDRRELVRSVAEALVGTGLDADRLAPTVDDLTRGSVVIEISRDTLDQPRYSTPEMVRIERELVEMAVSLATRDEAGLDPDAVGTLCRAYKLSIEQTAAALAATGSGALAIVEGAPGTGKTTLLKPIVQAWQAEGYRVIGAATAWRVANALRDDLEIEARATASWMTRAELGHPFLDRNAVLIVDEAGLLSSREMHALLGEANQTGARVLLVGDRDQLQAIGAGSGLALAARATEAARVGTIVRQHDAWAREAVVAFGQGEAEIALQAFADHGKLVEIDGYTAAVKAVVDRVETDLVRPDPGSVLILARTNADVAAIGGEVRRRLNDRGILTGAEVTIDTVTSSGHSSEIAIAAGERLRFLTRLDTIGVVNGSLATVTRMTSAGVDAAGTRHARIEALVGDRPISFDTRELTDRRGRIRLGWAYASTVYGAQGMTVDRAAVLVTPAFDRHDIYVAASRARKETVLVLDRRAVDQHILGGRDDGPPASREAIDEAERRTWLASRLSRANAKETTLDVTVPLAPEPGYDRPAKTGTRAAAKPDRTHEVSFDL